MEHQNLGSIFVAINKPTDWRIDIYYGFKDATGSRAHIVLSGGAIEYWRGISGLNPLVRSNGSIYFD